MKILKLIWRIKEEKSDYRHSLLRSGKGNYSYLWRNWQFFLYRVIFIYFWVLLFNLLNTSLNLLRFQTFSMSTAVARLISVLVTGRAWLPIPCEFIGRALNGKIFTGVTLLIVLQKLLRTDDPPSPFVMQELQKVDLRVLLGLKCLLFKLLHFVPYVPYSLLRTSSKYALLGWKRQIPFLNWSVVLSLDSLIPQHYEKTWPS